MTLICCTIHYNDRLPNGDYRGFHDNGAPYGHFVQGFGGNNKTAIKKAENALKGRSSGNAEETSREIKKL